MGGKNSKTKVNYRFKVNVGKSKGGKIKVRHCKKVRSFSPTKRTNQSISQCSWTSWSGKERKREKSPEATVGGQMNGFWGRQKKNCGSMTAEGGGSKRGEWRLAVRIGKKTALLHQNAIIIALIVFLLLVLLPKNILDRFKSSQLATLQSHSQPVTVFSTLLGTVR